MKASNTHWQKKLEGKISEPLSSQIDAFETNMHLRQQDKIDDKLFAELRLRKGIYGQRYDNGQRHNGIKTCELAYPNDRKTKGPNTLWHAPGMMRIKVPYGGLSAQQCEVLAELAEEYSDGIAHVTTRQDFQLHFIHIDDTPSLMRRLAAVGITTQEACGNSVRNVTACPRAGCCQEELFDVTPYAKALTYFFLGHHDVQDFGRKFKIAFSGCKQNACGLTNIHDLGLVASIHKNSDGTEKRGFAFYVGGGLGAVPHQAKLIEEFIPEEELLPMAQAVSRVFSRLGEKKNRARARIKFLVAKLGVEEFRRLVQEERQKQPKDQRWTEYLSDIDGYYQEGPLAENDKEKLSPNIDETSDDFLKWQKVNVYKQKQEGYSIVTVKLPLGDLSAQQLRAIADISRKYIKDSLRTTVEQNIVLRWVYDADLLSLYTDLKAANLGEIGANGITDIVACPATDTCKLGISSSRGLAAELRQQFQNGEIAVDKTNQNLHLKISGCFNSCAQHHVSDLGFYGVSRKINGRTVPHFQVVIGGQWEENAGSYGLPIGAIPSKNIPEVVRRLTKRYQSERESGQETFHSFIKRLGKAEAKKTIIDLSEVPLYEKDRSYYSDWGDPREYTIGDMGIGECAGEVIDRVQMDIAAAERELFEAQLLLEKKDLKQAGELAYQAMINAARALVKTYYLDVSSDPEIVISEFRKHFYDTKLFFDPYAGGKFANYLFTAAEKANQGFDTQSAHHRVEEANLFIEAAHSCNLRMSNQPQKVLIK